MRQRSWVSAVRILTVVSPLGSRGEKMMLMYIDSDDSENEDWEAAGVALTSHDRLILEAPSSAEKQSRRPKEDGNSIPENTFRREK